MAERERLISNTQRHAHVESSRYYFVTFPRKNKSANVGCTNINVSIMLLLACGTFVKKDKDLFCVNINKV